MSLASFQPSLNLKQESTFRCSTLIRLGWKGLLGTNTSLLRKSACYGQIFWPLEGCKIKACSTGTFVPLLPLTRLKIASFVLNLVNAGHLFFFVVYYLVGYFAEFLALVLVLYYND